MPVRRVITTFAGAFSTTPDAYASPISPRLWASDLNAAQVRWLAPAYFRNLDIELDTAPGSGNAWTFTLLVDGVATDVQITISGTSTRGILDDGVVGFAPRDSLVALRRTASGAPAAVTAVRYNILVDGIESRISCYGGYPGLIDQTAHFLNPAGWYGGIVGHITDVLPVAFTLKEWTVRLTTAPGVGKSRSFIVQSADPNSELPTFTQDAEIVISDNEVEGSVSPDVTWPAGRLVHLIQAGTGSPATAHANWCVRGHIAGADGQSVVATSDDPTFRDDGTAWYGANGSNQSNVSESAAALTVRSPFTLQTMYVKQFDGTPEGTELFVTTRKNNANTVLEVNLAGPEVAGEYGFDIGAVSFASGDTWDTQISNGGSPVSFGHVGQWSWLMQALAEAPTGEIGPLLWIVERRLVPE